MDKHYDDKQWFDKEKYDASRPSGSLVLAEIVQAISAQLEIEIGERHEEHVNFRIGDKAWLMVRIEPERLSVSSELWKSGLFNWNGKWNVELQMGTFGNRTKKWRPDHDRRATMVKSVVETIQSWVADYGKPNIFLVT